MALEWDDVLAGWLVFLHVQGDDCQVCMPSSVRSALAERGWIELQGSTQEGVYDYALTERGLMVAELNAGDWAVNSIPDV